MRKKIIVINTDKDDISDVNKTIRQLRDRGLLAVEVKEISLKEKTGKSYWELTFEEDFDWAALESTFEVTKSETEADAKSA
jgi:hypothetical protein